MNRQRQAEGIAAAKLRGVKFGRTISIVGCGRIRSIIMWRRRESNSVRRKPGPLDDFGGDENFMGVLQNLTF